MKKNRKRSRAAKARQPRKRSALGAYANGATILYGIDDVTIQFTRSYPDGTEWPSENVASVTIPLSVAKLVMFGLLSNIAMMEGVVGPIRVAPGLVPPMPSSPMLTPEMVARIAVMHAELFAAPSHAPKQAESADAGSGSITKH